MESQQVKGEWRSDFDGPPQPPGGAVPGQGGPTAPVAGNNGEEATQEGSEGGLVSTFPDEWRNDFEGLMYLGYLEDTVQIPNHHFDIQTILPAAKLDIVQICRPFEGSIGFARAYKAACVGAAIVRVDGRQIIVAEKERSAVRQKYEYVINTWYDPVIDLIYDACEILEGRQLEVMRHLGVIGPAAQES